MNNFFKNTFLISLNTFKQIAKSKILFLCLILAFILAIVTFIAAEITFGTPLRVSIDFGLGISELVSVFISILLGVNLISDEIESRTLYMVVSRPVERESFILGKIFGLAGINLFNIAVLFLSSWLISIFYGGIDLSVIFPAYGFIFFISFLMLLLTVLLSLAMNKVLSVIFAVVFYFSSYSITSLLKWNLIDNFGGLKNVLNFLSYILPPFEKLNLKEFVFAGKWMPDNFISNGLIFFIVYSLILLFLNLLIFNQKEFE